MAALEEKLLEQSQYKPWLWWRYIDDVFLVWTHGEEKLLEFVDFLNSAHHSIKFTVEYSKETVNFLDVQVIKQGNKVVTDLYTKPTDTHQLLHRSSCHPGHTKKGIPYGQALRIRRICSEDSFFEKRLGNLENFLLDRGYNRGEIQGQFDRARGLDRNTLLDRNQKNRDDTKIPLVLTYHPAFHRVYGILQTCLNALFVDTEHQQLFKEKIFVSFRRAKKFQGYSGSGQSLPTNR